MSQKRNELAINRDNDRLTRDEDTRATPNPAGPADKRATPPIKHNNEVFINLSNKDWWLDATVNGC